MSYFGFWGLSASYGEAAPTFDSYCSSHFQGDCETEGGSGRICRSRNGSECRAVERNGVK